MKKFLKISISIFIIFIILFFAGIVLYKPQIDNIPYSQIIFDKNEIRIGEIIYENNYRHEKLDFNEIPEFTKKAILAMEDKTFFKNVGIDFVALIRASYNNFKGNTTQGASTISTQVIKNSYWLNEERTFGKKIKEFYLALALNFHYSKEEILENYLGNIYFGYLNYGLKSASNYYFGKELKNLTSGEQLALIILPKNPAKYDPYTKKYEFRKRFELIANYLKENNIISENEFNEIINENIILNQDHRNILPYVVDFIKYDKLHVIGDISDKKIIETTIDYNLTKKIEEIAKNSITPLFWKNVNDYSALIIDRNTNEIRVMIGGIDYYDKEGQVSMITSLRQAGSTIKPFTYVLAFQNLGYEPETTILDLPVQFENEMGYAYNPKNYSLDYKGEVSVAEALSQSINIPAVKVAHDVGVGNLLDFLHKVGFSSLTKNEDYYGLALTLGVGEISLYELTRAYTIFAYNGKFCELKIFKNENKNCKNVINSEFTDKINYILKNRYFKLNEFPINGNLDFEDKEVFLKTGTSRNFKDNWVIGYTENYIIGIWTGNKDGKEMKGVSGATGAGEIFKAIVDYLEKEKGHSNPEILNTEKLEYLEIISPLKNSKFQISKNIPTNSQKIKLEFNTNIDYSYEKWFLNGEKIDEKFIDLKKGNHSLKVILYDENDFKIEEKKVNFFVE